MTTLEIPADVDLRDLVSAPGRTSTVYFRRPRSDESTAARRHAVVGRLAEQGADAHVLRVVDDALCDVRPGRGAVAIFATEPAVDATASHGDGNGVRLTLVDMPDAGPTEATDLAAHSSLPNLLPLLAWRQSSPAHVVAVLDRAGADIALHPAGGGEPSALTITGPDDEITGHAPAERSADRFHHRAEDSWRHNAAHDRDVATQALLDSGARILLVAGEVHAVQLFTEALPSSVRHEIDVLRIAGGRSPDGSQRRRPDHVAAAVAQAVAAETRALLSELADEHRPGGLGVQGASAVLHALARGRVRTLLVTDSGTDERIAWFGAKPTELSGHRSDLERIGADARRARLVDAAVRAAILTGADVRVLRPKTPAAPEQGLGALCRFQ